MIIGFNGYAKAGKSECAKILIESFPERNFKIVGFSTALKQVAEILTGIPAADFEKQEVKKNTFFNITTGQVRIRKTLPKGAVIFEEPAASYPENSWLSMRCFLQDIGTNGLRARYPNAWVIPLMREYDRLYMFDDTPNWIIPDLRFLNEANPVRDRKGVIVRVNRLFCKAVNNHPSEVELDGYDHDKVIDNNGTLEDLKNILLNEFKPILC